jgi:phage baseplate assembly protein V
MHPHIRRLLTRLQSVVTRGVITRTNDESATQTIQVELRFDEIADAIEHFQPFGVSFRPTPDSEVIVLAADASQDNLVAIAATNRSVRPTGIEEGEGGLYTPSGWKVFCDADDNVDIGAKDLSDEKLVAWAQKVEDELAKIKDAHNTHTHGSPQATSGNLLTTPPSKSPAGTPVAFQYTPGDVKCSKTRVE